MHPLAFEAGFAVGQEEVKAKGKWERHPGKKLVRDLRAALREYFNEDHLGTLPTDKQPAFTISIPQRKCEPTFQRRFPKPSMQVSALSCIQQDAIEPAPLAIAETSSSLWLFAPDPDHPGLKIFRTVPPKLIRSLVDCLHLKDIREAETETVMLDMSETHSVTQLHYYYMKARVESVDRDVYWGDEDTGEINVKYWHHSVLEFSLSSSTGLTVETKTKHRLAGDDFDLLMSGGAPIPNRGCRMRAIRIGDALILMPNPTGLCGLPDSEGLEVPHLAVFPFFGRIEEAIFVSAQDSQKPEYHPKKHDRSKEWQERQLKRDASTMGMLFVESEGRSDFMPCLLCPTPLNTTDLILTFSNLDPALPFGFYNRIRDTKRA